MYNISIRQRIFVVVLCTTLILFSILYLAFDLTYLRGYENLEKQDAAENIDRVTAVVSNRLEIMTGLCKDWAIWDETYQFAEDGNTGYIERNLSAEASYANVGVSLFLVLNTEGEVVYHKGFDHTRWTDIVFPEKEIQSLANNPLINNPDNAGVISGMVQLYGIPFLVVSEPILTSTGEGPSTGILIMGRFMDPEIMADFTQSTKLSISVMDIHHPGLPQEVKETLIKAETDESDVIITQKRNLMEGYIVYRDIYGQPAVVLKVDMPRQIYNEGEKSLAYLHISLFFVSITFFLVFSYLINITVIKRMTTLSQDVNVIGEKSNLSKRVSAPGADEISGLASNINKMLDSLEKSESEIRTQKEFIDQILANTPNAVVVTDMRQQVILANSTFDRLLGLTTGSSTSQQIRDIPHLQELTKEIAAFLQSQAFSIRTELHCKDDDFRKTLAVTFTRMKGNNLLLITLSDITADVDRQDRLYLTDRLASVGEMASGIAHELNNPLSSIVGLSELLKEEDLPESIREDIATINSEAQRAAGVVKNMLSFARRHASNRQPVLLNQVVEDILKLRAYHWTISNITVKCEMDPKIPAVMADYFQMQQVFLNIILNAEQSMTEAHGKGILKITSEKTGTGVKIIISDNGQGIAQENLKRIFDPFFTTKDVGHGTGLGLSICYGIISAHKGQIDVRSEVGKGATFIIEIPFASNFQEAADVNRN